MVLPVCVAGVSVTMVGGVVGAFAVLVIAAAYASGRKSGKGTDDEGKGLCACGILTRVLIALCVCRLCLQS